MKVALLLFLVCDAAVPAGANSGREGMGHWGARMKAALEICDHFRGVAALR